MGSFFGFSDSTSGRVTFGDAFAIMKAYKTEGGMIHESTADG